MECTLGQPVHGLCSNVVKLSFRVHVPQGG